MDWQADGFRYIGILQWKILWQTKSRRSGKTNVTRIKWKNTSFLLFFSHYIIKRVKKIELVLSPISFSSNIHSMSTHCYYPTTDEIEELFAEFQFQKEKILSIRGFGYEKKISV